MSVAAILVMKSCFSDKVPCVKFSLKDQFDLVWL